MGTLRSLFVVAAACLFAACATPLSISQNRPIGVVALIPDKLQTKYNGFLALTNQGADADAPEARLAEGATAITESSLRAHGFDVRSLGSSHPALAAKYDRHSHSLARLVASPQALVRQSVGPEIQALAAAQHVKSVALILPFKEGLGNGGERTVGVGDYGFGLVSSNKDEVSAYTATQLLVVDAQTLAQKGFIPLVMFQPPPGLNVPFEKDWARYSPEQKRMLAQAMKDIYRTALERQLEYLTRP